MRGPFPRARCRRAILLAVLVCAAGLAGSLGASVAAERGGAGAASPEVSAPGTGVGQLEDVTTTGALHPPSDLRAQEESPFVPLQEQPDADATVTRIALHENGSATWTIKVRTRLESAEEVARYETFQAQFRENRSRFRSAFQERMTGVVENTNRSLDRPMAAEAFTAETQIEEAPQRWGVVRYGFRWDGFAAGGDGRIVAGDVFQGNFFIDQNSVLEVELPEGYTATSVEPAPDNRGEDTMEWEGPTSFSSGEPRVVAEEPGGDGDGAPLWLLVGGGGLLTLVLLGGVVLAWRRRLLATGDEERTAPATASEASEGRPYAAADPGPVTDEERVRHVLDAQGGRCKQSAIVEELEWSKSKTSRVLSRMAEDGSIEKFRIGRENVIELPDDGEDEFRSDGD